MTKTTCSVNFTAGVPQRDFIYYWDFGNGTTHYGANPPALKYPPGKYEVILRVLDSQTLSIRDDIFYLKIDPLLTPKKNKVGRVQIQATPKPLIVK